MFQFVKMTWMFFWRICLFSFAMGAYNWTMNLVVAAVFAALIRFGSKKTVPFFPMLRLFGRKSIFVDVFESEGKAVEKDNTPYSNKEIQNSATNRGIITGYEPSALEGVGVPDSNRIAMMRGIPGSGLSSASHMGSRNIKTGQIGEANLAKILNITNFNGVNQGYADKNSLINRVSTFWSVAMPSIDNPAKRDPQFETDIDCIVVSGDEILLVDTKFYKSGDVTYKAYGNMIYCEDNITGNLVGKPHRMTNNMKMAQERFKKLFPEMRVSSIVVLMPTDAGSPKIESIYWPGSIPAVDVTTAINKISSLSYSKSNKSSAVLPKLAMLVKK